MNALGIVYPQFWMQFYVDLSFSLQFNVINKHDCETKKMKPVLDQVIEPLNANILDLQPSMFKFTKKL
jgi:hypothetical protein